MAKIPRGMRHPEDLPLFKQPTDDPTIRPDTVTPAVEGYFRIPAVWVGDKPDDGSVLTLNPRIHHAVVLERKLCSGIKVRVQRDGTFLFDFSSWQHAPQIVIPGYRIPIPRMPHRRPRETEDRAEESEKYAVIRAQLMNVHQACLTTSERLVKRRFAEMGLPLTSDHTIKDLTFDQCNSYTNSLDTRSLARNALNNKDGIKRNRPFSRRTLEIEVVDQSLNLLDQILQAEDTRLIQMIEAVYLAAGANAQGRPGETVTSVWGVCEQLLSLAWKAFLNESKDFGRMPATRRKKLSDRDYTASVMIEMLELGKRINYDLYLHLEEARKARNRWTHDMLEPSGAQVSHAIWAVERLFQEVYGIHITLPLTGLSPGVPGWNIWIWEAVKGSIRGE